MVTATVLLSLMAMPVLADNGQLPGAGIAAPPAYDYTPAHVPPPPPPSVAAPKMVTYADEETGLYCREYSQAIRIGNRIQESYGTACLQPNGTWRVAR